ncbi:GNAT family N-acetyltransferase [Halobacterium jilantaiense]|uniref:Protein N-acetyltransferase, RimJ/RimL family n=1 Tax=Halobacterium jilantaiense TaxID=355548 RepID=A0A1I0QKY1_9EURY|nr:GNAT family protein [Halobacterium jilantaiense]SEW27805.1 Protein N-acetyltransferase, RimJ/RimL family [Halobacterium jilantaiense]
MTGDSHPDPGFPEVLTTQRLRLERCCRENVPVLELYRAASDRNPHIDAVTEHLTWEPHESVQASRETLAHFEQTWADGDIATYAVRPKASEPTPDSLTGSLDGERGVLAGTCALTCDWAADCATLGVWLRKEYWGRGYSGERADALLELAFDRLDFGVVAVCHDAGNEQSRRAIESYVERHGGRREGLLRNVAAGSEGGVDQVRYTISQSEWRTAGRK